jgi:hypothetical protein
MRHSVGSASVSGGELKMSSSRAVRANEGLNITLAKSAASYSQRTFVTGKPSGIAYPEE